MALITTLIIIILILIIIGILFYFGLVILGLIIGYKKLKEDREHEDEVDEIFGRRFY